MAVALNCRESERVVRAVSSLAKRSVAWLDTARTLRWGCRGFFYV